MLKGSKTGRILESKYWSLLAPIFQQAKERISHTDIILIQYDILIQLNNTVTQESIKLEATITDSRFTYCLDVIIVLELLLYLLLHVVYPQLETEVLLLEFGNLLKGKYLQTAGVDFWKRTDTGRWHTIQCIQSHSSFQCFMTKLKDFSSNCMLQHFAVALVLARKYT